MTQFNRRKQLSDVIDISEAYRNALSCGLRVVEDMLSDISAALEKNTYQTRHGNMASVNRRVQEIQEQIDSIRMQIETIKTKLNLESRSEDLGATIMSRCAKVWQVLCELKSDRLRAYGNTPSSLHGYLDPRIDGMIKRIESILEIAKEHVHKSP